MRIAIGGMFHESNSFSTEITTLDDFRRWSLTEGGEVVEHWRDSDSELAGMIDVAEAEGVELVPTCMAWAAPSGPIDDDAVAWIIGRIVAGLRGAGRVDGVLLSLHGASVGRSEPDPEARLLRAVREVIGPALPVIATTDFHANVSAEMVRALTSLVGYDTYPHVDFRPRGREAAEMMVRTVRGEIAPTVAQVRPPLMCVPQVQATADGPMHDIMEEAHAIEATRGVLNVTVSGGFAYNDIPEPGVSVVVTSDRDADLARSMADRLAKRIWSRRGDLVGEWPGPVEAVRLAMGAERKPVILVDIGDNVGGGTPGDGTGLLAELLRQGAGRAVAILHDPIAVERCIEAGLGTELALEVGGRSDPVYGPPCPVIGRVGMITDGSFDPGNILHKGFGASMGRTVRLDVSDNQLVLTERRTVPWSLGQLRSAGIEPAERGIIVVKAAIAYQLAYESIAGTTIECGTPGWTAPELGGLPYGRLRHPRWPLDRDVAWP
ncbi:MAG: M81 family metallopeptidase [Phycisphaerae bacterium]|nr:M81 family metallopeptidase [Phycisphaerae bacterium]